MNNVKKAIIIIGVLLVILIILFILNTKLNNNVNNNNLNITEAGNEDFKPKNELNKIQSIPNVITINNAVNKYINYIYNNNNQAVYSVLINDCIENNNINKNNAIHNIGEINYECKFISQDVYEYSANLSVQTFLVKGYILDINKKNKEEYNVVLNIDTKNKTFEIAPFKKVYNNSVNYDNISMKNKDINNEITNIEENSYNKITISNGLRK